MRTPADGARGVLIAQGGSFGGWVLHLNQGRPNYVCNLLGTTRFSIEGEDLVPAGEHQLAWSSTTTAAGSARAVEIDIDAAAAVEDRPP